MLIQLDVHLKVARAMAVACSRESRVQVGLHAELMAVATEIRLRLAEEVQTLTQPKLEAANEGHR